MRMAITSRRGPDTSPLVLRIEQTAWDRQPPIGTAVCAIGAAGWTYYGSVTALDPDGAHYTIGNVVAANKWLDNIKLWNGAAPEPPQEGASL